MKTITVYNSKGGVGKTPISLNLIFDNDDYYIATNESFHIYDFALAKEDNRYYSVDMNEEMLTGGKDMIFDLAGSISKESRSIVSAIKLSDVVIVPIVNEIKSMFAGVKTIREIKNLNTSAKIIVVVTKLEKVRQDTFNGNNWQESIQFLDVKDYVIDTLKDKSIDFLPLKLSKAFDEIFEKNMSIKQIMKHNPIRRHNYRDVSEQFNDIYKAIGITK